MPLTTLPALLGGNPVFSTPLPMARPKLPDPSEILPTVELILRTGNLTKGPELSSFEAEAASYLGVPHCVGVSSCTSGLMLCLQALSRRLPAGASRKVAVPSFTFLASITSLIWAGFEPLFLEVDPATMNLSLEHLEAVLSHEQVAGVLAVHCFGNPLETEPLEALCHQYGTRLMFDAAHGFGSIHKGVKVGRAGWCQVFSLTPTKMVVAGEGGLVSTSDPHLAEELHIAREYGNDGRYDTVFPGLNARLSELHSCLGRASLKMLEEVVAHRNEVANRLQAGLSEIPGIGFQAIAETDRTTYKDFTIVIDPEAFGLRRDRAAAALLSEGIPSRKYFSPPCHQHQAFRDFALDPLPLTETLAARCLSIPLLDLDSVEGIVAAFQKIQVHSARLDKVGQTV